MPDVLAPIVDRIAALAAAIRGAPHFEWGTVASSSPLTVQLDGDSEPMLGTPSRLVSNLFPGERVLVMIQNRRATVVGRGGGTVYRSGEVLVSTGTLTNISGTGTYGTTLTFTVPAVPPPGCAVRVEALRVGTGYGSIALVSQAPGVSSTTVTIRFTQVGAGTVQTLTVRWEIVPNS